MAKCEYCGKDMLKAHSCVKVMIRHNGKDYEPIRFGDEEDLEIENDERCHDCNCKKGGYHHPGCDMERCPVCGGQLISCGCLGG